MADFKKKETKVLSLSENPKALSEREQRLIALQAAIDKGLYRVSSDDIAKAYLHGPHDEPKVKKTKSQSEKTTKSDLKTDSVSKINK